MTIDPSTSCFQLKWRAIHTLYPAIGKTTVTKEKEWQEKINYTCVAFTE